MPECSGTRQDDRITTATKPGSTPFGLYSASNIAVPPGTVNHVDLIFPATTQENFNGPQTYQQVIDGCLFLPSADPPQCVPMPPNNTTFTNGHYVDMGNQGPAFIPAKGSFINQLLEIHWCPAQNYFLVKFLGHLLPTLKYTPTMFSAVAP